MNKFFQRCSGILVMALLSSCDAFESVYTTSCVAVISECDWYSVQRTMNIEDGDNIWPSYQIAPHETRVVSVFNAKGEDKKWFNSVCEKYGDTGYNRTIQLHISEYRNAFIPSITSIDVTSNKDFDSQHPAGTSLAEYFNVSFMNNINYIRSGYDPNLPEGMGGVMSEINPEEMLFTGSIGFTLKKYPEELSVYKFFLDIKNEEGQEFHCPFYCDFERIEVIGSSSWQDL